ncbi:MAG: hypothetical protein JSU90_09370 [Nitrospiraceae bacterium]|nr:MAG: hypothetical protein JSU90_09370 [Nitrospiraceae bacterium]
MQIDARHLELVQLFKKLKELLDAGRGEQEILIDVLVNTASDANKVKTFVSMSGCGTEIDKKDNLYIIHVKGFPCCT